MNSHDILDGFFPSQYTFSFSLISFIFSPLKTDISLYLYFSNNHKFIKSYPFILCFVFFFFFLFLLPQTVSLSLLYGPKLTSYHFMRFIILFGRPFRIRLLPSPRFICYLFLYQRKHKNTRKINLISLSPVLPF